jgi:hypothetical protein
VTSAPIKMICDRRSRNGARRQKFIYWLPALAPCEHGSKTSMLAPAMSRVMDTFSVPGRTESQIRDFTNGRRSNVDGPIRRPIRRANPDGRTRTQAVLHTRAVPHRQDIPRPPLAAARQQQAGEPRRSRQRWEPTPRRRQAAQDGTLRENFPVIARNFAIGRYRQIRGHCRPGKS